MEIKHNQIVDDEGRVICEFNVETFEDRRYNEGVTQAQKMAVGRMLKPYVDGRKKLAKPQEEAPVKRESEDRDWASIKPLPNPWEAFQDCPPPGEANDKTPEVVRWLFDNHPDYYNVYYRFRRTCVDEERANEKNEWEEKGREFYRRGLKITDCPIGASQRQKDHFTNGYKKYMLSETEYQQTVK